MATSLAEQLKKLALPQTSLLDQGKKRASLLFDPKEASNLDRSTVYEIGLSGFEELKKLNPAFELFESTLFSQSSKDFERSVQSHEVNEQLNKMVKKFMLLLSPYFLLKSSHKSLEWLIHRFHIHTFNKDEIFMLILPYHETNIFVRFLQILDIKDPADRWHWLYPLQKPGIILPKSAMINHCTSDLSFLQFLGNVVIAATKEHGSTASNLTTLYAFYCTTVIGTLDASDKVTEKQISHLLPSLLKGLSSESLDFVASVYMIIAQLISKAILKETILLKFVSKVISSSETFKNESALLLVLIYQSQNSVLKTIPANVVNKLATFKWFPNCLVNITMSGGYIIPFLMALYSEIFKLIQTSNDTEKLKDFAESLLTLIKLDDRSTELLILILLNNCVLPASDSKPPSSSSPIKNNNVQEWYRKFLKRIEVQHSDLFNKTITSIMNEETTFQQKKNAIKFVLNFSLDIQKDSNLFEKLYSPNSKLRLEAVKYFAKNYGHLSEKEKELFKEPLRQRFKDDNEFIINYLLKLPNVALLELFEPEDLIDVIIDILFKCRQNKQQWNRIIGSAVKILCSGIIEGHDLKIFFTVLPFLFPLNDSEVCVSKEIINSSFGSKNPIITHSKGLLRNVSNVTSEHICTVVYKSMDLKNKFLHCEIVLDYIGTMPEKYIDDTYKCLFITVLSACVSKGVEPGISRKILDKIFLFIVSSRVVKVNTSLNKNIKQFLTVSYNGNLPLECFIHCITNIIKYTKLTNVTKLNFEESSDTTEFLLFLYEILITGCSLELENMAGSYVETLRLFFCNYFRSFKKTMEFLCCIVIGNNEKRLENNLYVNTELKLQSMKLLDAMLKETNESLNWIVSLNSTMCIPAVVTSLMSPIRQIRKLGILILETIIKSSSIPNDQNSYLSLITYLVKRKEEILLDSEQLPLLLYSVLSPDKSVQKSFKNKKLKENFEMTLQSLINLCCDEKTTIGFSSSLLKMLTLVNSVNILKKLAPVALRVMAHGNNVENTLFYNFHQSNILFNIFSRVNTDTLDSLDTESIIWEMIKTALKQQNTMFISENDKYMSPAIFIIDILDKHLFEIFPELISREILNILIDIGTESENSDAVSAASKFIKHIDLDINLIIDILNSMKDAKINTLEIQSNKRRSKRTSIAPSIEILNTKEWKKGITLLEHLQNKKKVTNIHLLLPLLFEILNKCLHFLEQASLEYTKQLVLSCIINCCQKLDPKSKNTNLNILESAFNIELVVQCIRATQNPQTHHHALLVLAQTANIIPEQVLHHIMAIFTFMGSSVLRHDDAYSFQIISKVIDTVVPILVEKDKVENTDELQEISKVAPVLCVFVDVMLDIPVHRRIPLFIKLLNTLNAKKYLWVLLALIFENQVNHAHEDKQRSVPNNTNTSIVIEESPKRLEIAQTLTYEFSPEIILHSCIKLLDYIRSLPDEKESYSLAHYTHVAPLFDINNHTPKQFRHFKYVLICFLSGILSNEPFVRQIASLDDDTTKTMEPLYKSMIINILAFIQSVSKTADLNSDKPQGKYWKVMLHHSYDILDSINSLLSCDMFLIVVKGLMAHNLSVVRRKVMELLNSRLQRQDDFFDDNNSENMLNLIDPLLNVIKTLKDDTDESLEIEDEQNQQTALFSIKLLSKCLASKYPDKFKPILDFVTDLAKSKNIEGNVLASLVLCLAELCSSLRVHSLYSLSNFMPILLKILKKQKEKDIPDLLTLSISTALLKVVETLPLFLNPYLERILFEISVLVGEWLEDSDNQKVSPVLQKLRSISEKIATTVPPRVLIPSINQCYIKLLNKEKYDSISILMDVLANCIKQVQGTELKSILGDLTSFFLSALQFRSDSVQDSISLEKVSIVEGQVVKALMALILKLSESSFRPLYYKLFDWAARNVIHKDRAITFYRVSSSVAECLKSLFVLFAGHFISHAANILDDCNKVKREALYFENENKCVLLIEYVLKTLHLVFTYDTQNFINKERFETLMQPIVDQLENTVGGIESFKTRSKDVLTPCIAQFAVAAADDALWKQLNYQILLKTRHSTAEIRLTSLECICSMATKLGEDFLPLLPETIPFLAELLEDEDENVEMTCKKAVQELEKVLGEPLQKYF